MPGLQVWSPAYMRTEGNQSMFLSHISVFLSPFPYLPLSLKSKIKIKFKKAKETETIQRRTKVGLQRFL